MDDGRNVISSTQTSGPFWKPEKTGNFWYPALYSDHCMGTLNIGFGSKDECKRFIETEVLRASIVR